MPNNQQKITSVALADNKSNAMVSKKFYKTDKEEPLCGYCLKSKQFKVVYYINSELGKIPVMKCAGHTVETCPRLAVHVCEQCGEKGHTKRFCNTEFCGFCYNSMLNCIIYSFLP